MHITRPAVVPYILKVLLFYLTRTNSQAISKYKNRLPMMQKKQNYCALKHSIQSTYAWNDLLKFVRQVRTVMHTLDSARIRHRAGDWPSPLGQGKGGRGEEGDRPRCNGAEAFGEPWNDRPRPLWDDVMCCGVAAVWRDVVLCGLQPLQTRTYRPYMQCKVMWCRRCVTVYKYRSAGAGEPGAIGGAP